MLSNKIKSNTSLYIGKDEIPLLKNKADTFLHKSTVLYGSSGSGKSVLIKHILYLLKDKIPQILIINPTNKLNQDYTNIIPNQFIYDEIDENFFTKIYNKQSMAMQCYEKANNLDNLKVLYLECANYDEKDQYKSMEQIYIDTELKIKKNYIHITQRKPKLKQLKETHNTTIRKFFKNIIEKNMNLLISKSDQLTEENKIILKFLRFNPNLLLIFDDCGSRFKTWGKYTGVKELFFNGRHYKVTTLMAFQSDTTIPPDLRQNAFISIFTTKTCASSFIEKTTNGISKNDKKKFLLYIDNIFKSKSEYINYQKVCYFRLDQEFPIQYIIGDIHEDFKLGNKYLWKLSELVKKKDEDIDIDNEFYESFKV